jgi:hypothetical protein
MLKYRHRVLLAIATFAWLRIDGTEILIPDAYGESVPEAAVPALG